MRQALLFTGALLLMGALAHLAWGDTLVAARQTAEQGNYDTALATTDTLLQTDPDNGDARLLKAQIHGWQKNYDAAKDEFDYLLNQDPSNTDALLGRGYMYYAEDALDAAEWDFVTALAINPDDKEAQEGWELVQKAKQDPEQTFLWQADVGGEFSTFARAPETNWNNEFIQLTRQFPDSGTAVHALVQRYDEFEKTDMYYEAGIDQRFSPWLNGYFYGGGTPNPSFRQILHVATGGMMRLYESAPAAVWATLDLHYDDYPDTQVGNSNPGLRYEFADNWALSGTLISVVQSGDDAKYGWQGRLDGQIKQGWRFYTGFADAPETVDSSTVTTQSIFLGAAVDIDAANTVNAGYTHDDRENSYIRHAINAYLSHRF